MNGRTESRQGSEESENLKIVIKMAEGDRMRLRSMVNKDKEDNRGEATTHDGEGPDTTETVKKHVKLEKSVVQVAEPGK